MARDFKLSALLLRASKQLCVSKRTLYKWVEQGSVDCIKTEYERFKGMKLLTFTQVAELYNCSRSSIYRWAWEGKLPFVRICGRSLRIREEDALKAIEEFRENTN